jgi:hypothetical protein
MMMSRDGIIGMETVGLCRSLQMDRDCTFVCIDIMTVKHSAILFIDLI